MTAKRSNKALRRLAQGVAARAAVDRHLRYSTAFWLAGVTAAANRLGADDVTMLRPLMAWALAERGLPIPR